MKFINRNKEVLALKSYMEAPPGQILIVYGPKSTGKTTLLQHFAAKYLDQKK